MYPVVFSISKEAFMITKNDIYDITKEKFCPYAGAPSPAFIPLSAGITYEDPHYHVRRFNGDHYVFEYVLNGSGYVEINGKTVRLDAGDAYILCPCTYHNYYSDPRTPWRKVWFNGQGDLIAHLMNDYQLNDNCYIRGGDAKGKYLLQILETIEKEPIHCINELALLLHHHIVSFSEVHNGELLTASCGPLMKNFIEQRLTGELSMEEIAAHVHLSVSRATHLFKEEYNVTPYRYYLSRRLEIAQNLLRSTGMPIQEISKLLGFPDYRHFSNLFKRWTGISPSDFRHDSSKREDYVKSG